MNNNLMLELNGVTKTIGKTDIVHPVSLELKSGKILALCGGNGAGKSTLLRMIAGITQPTAGTLKVNGLEQKKSRKAYAESIGYMPDDFHFNQPLSAMETLLFYAKLKGVSSDKAMQTLEQVGLTDARDKPATAYSKGMRQRLLFAQALLADPPLLVLDEPTNGLDPFWMGAFVGFMTELKKAGHTVVFSTHQLHVAEEVADQVVFLADGRILRSGPLHKFKQEFPSSGLNGAFAELLKQSRKSSEES